MIIQSEANVTEMGGCLTAPSEFRIANSAHAFQILSQTLYSDKVMAVVREVISNAYDAHVKAGTPNEPILIHLPTALEPMFSVQDNGIGLSHESMVELYTTYFASTKQNNEEIGGFGLGCKSPFAYTKTFTVVSIYEGMMRTYSAMVNEDGVPVLVMLDEEETDKHNGLMVSIPVRSGDTYEFQYKTAQVLEFFPSFKVNLTRFAIQTTTYTHKGDGWAIRKQDGDHYEDPRILIGQVAYRLKRDSLKLSEENQDILRLPIDLFFNIGELDVTPSRESLSLNKRTVANLTQRLDSIQESILESLRKEIADAPSLWFAKLALKERLCEGSPFRSLIRKVIKQHFAQYQGLVLHDLTTELSLFNYKAMDLYTRRFTTRPSKVGKSINLRQEIANRKVWIETHEHVYFYVNDNKSYMPRLTKRLIEMLRDENYGENVTLYVFNPVAGASAKDVAKDFDAMVDELGVPEILFASDLPPVPKKPRGPQVPSDTCRYAWRFLGTEYQAVASNWEKVKAEEFTEEGPFLYVPVDRLVAEVSGQSLGHHTLAKIWKTLCNLGITVEVDGEEITLDSTTKLYGLNHQGQERVKNNPNWVNILSVVKATTFEVPQEYMDFQAAKNTQVNVGELPDFLSRYINGSMDALRPFVRGTVFHRQAVLIKRVNQLVSRCQNSTDLTNGWDTLLRFTGQTVDCPERVPEQIQKLVKLINVKEVTQKYAVLNYVRPVYYYSTVEMRKFYQIMGDYIQAVEAA